MKLAPMSTNKKCLLYSSGLDSYLGAAKEPDADLLYFDLGEVYSWKEIAILPVHAHLIKHHKTKTVNDAWNGFVPCRNLLLATLAVQRGYTEILINGMDDDNVEDKNEKAYGMMSEMLSLFSRTQIKVRSPFLGTTKIQAVRQYLFKGGNGRELSANTVSCYDEKEEQCGKCPACFRYATALDANGISSGVLLDTKLIKHYLKRLHTFDKERIWAICKMLQHRHYSLFEVDIDGVLTKEFVGHDYANRTPNRIPIICNNKTAVGSFVILHTSRPECERAVTEAWLEQHGVEYHALLMDKLPANRRIDDIATSGF